MENIQTFFTQDFYLKNLSTVDNIRFTKREIDVISCIVNAKRTSKKTASFLSIESRTIEVHIRNILSKLKEALEQGDISKLTSHSQEGIIDFIEASNKISFFKQYYSLLQREMIFKKSLEEIANLNKEKKAISLLSGDKNQDSFASHFKDHLEIAGFKLFATTRKKVDYLIFILPTFIQRNYPGWLKRIKQNQAKVFFIIPPHSNTTQAMGEFSNYEFIDFTQQKNYYFCFFSILKKLLSNLNFDRIFNDFKNQYKKIEGEIKLPRVSPKRKLKDIFSTKVSFISILLMIIPISSGLLILKGDQKSNNKNIVYSDLFLPSDSILLPRNNIISQLDEKFKNTKNSIQVIALVGPGGAGKTTIARQYVYQQKEKIDCLWEINAETKENLQTSFENLAKSLAITVEQKNILREIQAIENSLEKEERIIQFVKAQLQAHYKWVLIYDNVETFSNIQKYFPSDPSTWGSGKIIVTTRDSNIHNNEFVNHVITIEELNADEKITLFENAIRNEESSRSSDKEEDIRKFLDQIPSFPLDVCIAAYYLKATKTSFSTYLENITNCDSSFTNLQKTLLNEATGYTQTRYSLISLSLQHIINIQPEFKELLLLICLLDSQNIPREMLVHFKNEILVSQFIFNLRKYSLFTNQSSLTTLSMHRSIQSITLAYLVKTLNLEKNKKLIEKISESLASYMDKTLKQEDMPKMNDLISSCEILLKHKSLLKEDIRGTIKGTLGVIYFFIGDVLKAKTLLEDGISQLNSSYETDPTRVAFFLGYLGNVVRDLGDYHQGKLFLEKSLAIYNDHYLKDPFRYGNFLAYLGIIERFLGNYNAAKNLFEKAIMVQNQYFPENKNYLALASGQLGIIEKLSGNYKKAQEILEESYLTFQQNQAPIHDITWVLSHLASVYIEQGEYQKAKNYLENCLRLYAEDFPDQVASPWILSFLNSNDRHNQYKQANDSFNNILEKYKEQFLGQYIYVAEPLILLSNLYKKLGNYEKAKIILEQILLIYQRNYSNNHIETGKILRDLGIIYFLNGDMKTSEHLTYQALAIFERNKHPEKYTCLETLANIYTEKATSAFTNGDKKKFEEYKNQSILYLNQTLETIKIYFMKDSLHEKRMKEILHDVVDNKN